MTRVARYPTLGGAAQKILVLSPHPDDESLGCGALLARAFEQGGAHVVGLTDGSASHPNSALSRSGELARIRHREQAEAIAHLGGGAEDLTALGLPDAALQDCDLASVARNLADITDKVAATWIFAPSPHDHHADHKAAARIARILRSNRPELRYFTYPVWSRWDDPEFEQTIEQYSPFSLDVEPYRARKIAAIRSHRSQLGEVVRDDPEGFTLDSAFIDRFTQSDELFWEMV